MTVLSRAALLALLLIALLGTRQAPSAGTAPHLATSPKPDWRVDAGNTGHLMVSGPTITPTVVMSASAGSGATQGLELGAEGGLLFTYPAGLVESYRPDGTSAWQVDTQSTFGSHPGGPAPNPVAGADGFVYVGDDTGHIWRIDARVGTGTVVFTLPGCSRRSSSTTRPARCASAGWTGRSTPWA